MNKHLFVEITADDEIHNRLSDHGTNVPLPNASHESQKKQSETAKH